MICILYGSQTGQAKSISEDLYNKLKELNAALNIFELDELEKSYNIYNINYAVIICSTTGDGDAPENASKFLRRIKTYSLNSLTNFNYTILGLGDTNYSNFCNCGKTIDQILQDIGGKKFYHSGWADDGIGLEICVEPWLTGLYNIFEKICSNSVIEDFGKLKLNEIVVNNQIKLSSTHANEMLGDTLADDLSDKNITIPALPSGILYIIYNRDDLVEVDFTQPIITSALMPSNNSEIIMGKVTQIEKITKNFAIKPVHKVSLSLGNHIWKWSPGDSVGILPCNSEFEVDSILSRLGVTSTDRNCPIQLSIVETTEKRRAKIPEHLIVPEITRMSLKSTLMWLCDIRQPLSKVALRVMGEYCLLNSHEQRRLFELCSREGQGLYLRCIRETNMPLLDLLNWFPSCEIPIERLLEFLPRLKPRAYSMCDLEQVSFAFSKVDIAPKQNFRKRPLTGVCTSWIANMAKLDLERVPKIPMYLRKNLNGFSVSSEFSNPHILIGPGTGVAPFISFLQYFETLKKTGEKIGPIWLFFGCRNEERDFIFREEMEYFLNQGVLTHLCVCFSRDDPLKQTEDEKHFCRPHNCKYVQDCLVFHSQELSTLIVSDNARIFVCGDASGMSKDVLGTWSTVLTGNHDKITSKKEADSFITSMRVQKRYLEDIWV